MGTIFTAGRILFFLLLLLKTANLSAQNKAPQDFGFRYFQYVFQQDPVNILVLSQKGEEQEKKPLFLFVQGALPIPLIIYDEQGTYGTFPFKTDALLEHYHLAIIGKPFVPVVMEASQLQPNFTFTDSTGHDITEYSLRNFTDYYVDRNLEVLGFLRKQAWVNKQQLVVAGHSEGSTIATKMALQSSDVTQLIYSGGNPLGNRIDTIKQLPAEPSGGEEQEEKLFSDRKEMLNNTDSLDISSTDTLKSSYRFSIPPLQYLEKLSIPVLISYGSQDSSVLSNDFMRAELKHTKKSNFSFKSYPGLEDNYFGLTAEGEIDYNNYNWDKVAMEWLEWLLRNKQQAITEKW